MLRNKANVFAVPVGSESGWFPVDVITLCEIRFSLPVPSQITDADRQSNLTRPADSFLSQKFEEEMRETLLSNKGLEKQKDLGKQCLCHITGTECHRTACGLPKGVRDGGQRRLQTEDSWLNPGSSKGGRDSLTGPRSLLVSLVYFSLEGHI